MFMVNFPSELAFFAYNRTQSRRIIFRLLKKVISKGFKWAEDIKKQKERNTLARKFQII